jgi:hypothetical protein
VTWRKLTIAHYAAAVATLAIVLSCGSLYVAKLSYDLSLARDQRELLDKKPAIDIQLVPAGVSSLSAMISVTNRSEINISPLDIVAEPSVEAGELYFANDRQSIDKLNSSLSLTSMGTIAPKGKGTMKATLSGVTDGKFEQFRAGLELAFTVRIRSADQQDTVDQISIVRRILPAAGSPPLRPTPEMSVRAVVEAQNGHRNRQVFFYGLILLGLVVVLSLMFYVPRLWPRIAFKLRKSVPDPNSDSSAKEGRTDVR